MKISYSVKTSGPIFNGKRVDGRPQLTKAAYETLRQGRKIAQDNTPVKTGRLRRGWEVVPASTALENPVPYSVYVEEGTSRFVGRFYAEKSVPAIEDLFVKMVAKYTTNIGG